jgi:hypothetical protein
MTGNGLTRNDCLAERQPLRAIGFQSGWEQTIPGADPVRGAQFSLLSGKTSRRVENIDIKRVCRMPIGSQY